MSDDDLKTALGREGQTTDSYKASVKAELEKNELINRQVRKKVNITNEDVERYYKLNSKNYRAGDRARLRHILLALPEKASAEQTQATTEKAKDLYQRIKAGEDFAKLAEEFSQGAGNTDEMTTPKKSSMPTRALRIWSTKPLSSQSKSKAIC